MKRVLITGPRNTGKTSFINCVLKKNFIPKYTPSTKPSVHPSPHIIFTDWPGNKEIPKTERFDIIIVMFDQSNQLSFTNAVNYVIEMDSKCPVLMVGNKTDLPNVITPEELRRFIGHYGVEYFSISTQYKHNIDKLMSYLTK